MGLWSEDSVGTAWGLDVGHHFESIMSRTLGGRVLWEVGRLVRVIKGDVLVNAM
jgi:hypothetical protein